MSSKTKNSILCRANNSPAKPLIITSARRQNCEISYDKDSEEVSLRSKKSSSKSDKISDIIRTIHRTPRSSCETEDYHCDEVETGTMRTALESIAQEMQKFYSTGNDYIDSSKDQENLLEKLSIIRSTLVKKNSLIRRLKSNLKMACSLAQSVWSSKDSEAIKLSNRLQCARSEATMLLTVNKKRNSTFKQVESETNALRDKLNNFQSFIQRAYEELQRIRGEPYQDIPVSLQLRQIIISCGQYYADYTNEHAKCLQLEKKNRFLTNKINIMENNVIAPRKDVDLLRRLSLGRHEHKLKKISTTSFSEMAKKQRTSCFDCLENRKIDKTDCHLSTHLKLVRNILEDQDQMLKNLKNLVLELNN